MHSQMRRKLLAFVTIFKVFWSKPLGSNVISAQSSFLLLGHERGCVQVRLLIYTKDQRIETWSLAAETLAPSRQNHQSNLCW